MPLCAGGFYPGSTSYRTSGSRQEPSRTIIVYQPFEFVQAATSFGRVSRLTFTPPIPTLAVASMTRPSYQYATVVREVPVRTRVSHVSEGD